MTQTFVQRDKVQRRDHDGNVNLTPDVICAKPMTFDTGAVVGDAWVRLANLQLGGKRRQVLLFLQNCGDVPIEQVRLTRTGEPGGKHWRFRNDVCSRMPLGTGRTLDVTLSSMGVAEVAVWVKADSGRVRLTGVAR